ncbi:MAG: response regulator [Bacteroidetes bacterium]|nr:response regulator [Bacteroidota bacterium]
MSEKLIFFVDDDKMMLNLMEYTFSSRQGFAVKSFQSGEDCIKHLDEKPTVIVLDFILNSMVPENMSGMETLKHIKTAAGDIPVIILSKQKDEETISEFMNLGAEKYVTKDDYFIDTLIDTIESGYI